MKQELCQHLDELRSSGDYRNIVGMITSISDYELDYNLVTLLSEVYLRTYKYREAIDRLLSVYLQYITKMRWNVDEETILSGLDIEVVFDESNECIPDFDALSKFAYCISYKAVLFAKENKVPMRLDY